MIPKLQKKFISITAAALFIMILLFMIAINGIFIFQSNRSLDTRLKMIMDEHAPSDKGFPGQIKEDNTPEDMPDNIAGTPSEHPQPAPDIWNRFSDNLHIRADGCLIFVTADGTISEIRQDGAMAYSEEELTTIVAQILAGKKSGGWQEYFKYRIIYRTSPLGESETVIGLINASSDIYSIRAMLLISAGIGIISFMVILAIIIFASGKAVGPIAESYTKQKQFVTDAGHELKTPLTVISANNELARMIYGDSEWFDSIDNQVTKMNGLVRSLITLAKMDEEQKPVFARFNLSDAVYDTAKSFENLIHAGGRLITFDIAEDIPFTGDEAGLRQVVSILMDNAVKYCDPRGKIAVKLNCDKQIKLQVINDFASTSDCDFTQVFERFYRADKARTSDGSYGLGLSIAKSIVEIHKGEISAKTLEHERVMFEVILKP